MDIGLFLIGLAACFTAAATGATFQPGDWYDRLDKPRWTPPDWAFPVVWTTLYIFIAIAVGRAGPLDASGYAMGIFALQIALNTLWTPVFFGKQRMDGGMAVIACLWLAVAANLVAFWRLDLIAGLLFVPYLVWVSVAAALNWSVWRRNPNAQAA